MGKDRERSQRMGAGPSGTPARSSVFSKPGGGSSGTISYAAVPDIGRVLDAVASAGDAITCGRTSDGGACCVSLLHQREIEKEYARTQEELNALFADVARYYLPAAPSNGRGAGT